MENYPTIYVYIYLFIVIYIHLYPVLSIHICLDYPWTIWIMVIFRSHVSLTDGIRPIEVLYGTPVEGVAS